MRNEYIFSSLWISDDSESQEVLQFLKENGIEIDEPTRGFRIKNLVILIFDVDDENISPFLYDIGLAPTPRFFIGDEEIRGSRSIIKYLRRWKRSDNSS